MQVITLLETTGQLLSPKGQMLFHLCYPSNLLVAKQQKTQTPPIGYFTNGMLLLL